MRLPIFWRAMTGAMHRFIKIAEGCNTLFVKENEITPELASGQGSGWQGHSSIGEKSFNCRDCFAITDNDWKGGRKRGRGWIIWVAK